MRLISYVAFVFLFLSFPAWSQDSDYPTLDALAAVHVPTYGFPDYFTGLAADARPYDVPTYRKDYKIGDRTSLYLGVEDGEPPKLIETELRGKTKGVLIWVEAEVAYSHARAQALAERIDTEVLTPIRDLLNYREPLGVDRDSRLTVVLMKRHLSSVYGYADTGSLFYRRSSPHSNLRDMIVINLVGTYGGFSPDDVIIPTTAHEFQHLLMAYRNFEEEAWMDEAFSMFAAYYISGAAIFSDSAQPFLEAPDTRLTAWQQENPVAEYGASGLFLVYIADNFGDAVIGHLHGETDIGWRSVEKVLRDQAGVSANEVYADWVLANYFMDVERGFGYKNLDTVTASAQPTRAFLEFPARYNGSLQQYSSEYFAAAVGGADKLALQLIQNDEAHLMDIAPPEGDHVYYAITNDASLSTLTRAIELPSGVPIWLDFKLWYDLAAPHDFATVSVSTDGGDIWHYLKGEHTQAQNLDKHLSAQVFTGSSGGWLRERINISRFARTTPLLLRFEVVASYHTTYHGMAIDDLRIYGTGYRFDFEAPDSSWTAAGWIRTDNRLPQRTWVQVVQETPAGLHLDRHMMNASGEIIVDLLPSASIAHIAVSPVVPGTSLETEFSLELDLLDADNAPMAKPHICNVSSAQGLNFRDVPNGDKIGLVPYGTVVPALEISEGWFRVIYNNMVGWVHGDYVSRVGTCAAGLEA